MYQPIENYDFRLSDGSFLSEYFGEVPMHLHKSSISNIPLFKHWTAVFQLSPKDFLCVEIAGKNARDPYLNNKVIEIERYHFASSHNELMISLAKPSGEHFDEMGKVKFDYEKILKFGWKEIKMPYHFTQHNCQDFVNSLGEHLGIKKTLKRLDATETVGIGSLVLGSTLLLGLGTILYQQNRKNQNDVNQAKEEKDSK